jgi:hypothetical protein
MSVAALFGQSKVMIRAEIKYMQAGEKHYGIFTAKRERKTLLEGTLTGENGNAMNAQEIEWRDAE